MNKQIISEAFDQLNQMTNIKQKTTKKVIKEAEMSPEETDHSKKLAARRDDYRSKREASKELFNLLEEDGFKFLKKFRSRGYTYYLFDYKGELHVLSESRFNRHVSNIVIYGGSPDFEVGELEQRIVDNDPIYFKNQQGGGFGDKWEDSGYSVIDGKVYDNMENIPIYDIEQQQAL